MEKKTDYSQSPLFKGAHAAVRASVVAFLRNDMKSLIMGMEQVACMSFRRP
ncbi:MAG: hypothetical protein JEZ03_14415 [Bacteroidales bacterium]|nr:hypothetical protein [Bacteroidales bacterium]